MPDPALGSGKPPRRCIFCEGHGAAADLIRPPGGFWMCRDRSACSDRMLEIGCAGRRDWSYERGEELLATLQEAVTALPFVDERFSTAERVA